MNKSSLINDNIYKKLAMLARFRNISIQTMLEQFLDEVGLYEYSS